MADAAHTFSADLWLHPGESGWHFTTLPADLADELRARTTGRTRPFGSISVRATIGQTSWTTALFADTRAASYLLPVKAEVRRRERLTTGDRVHVAIDLLA